MSDTSGMKDDRTQQYLDALGDNPRCMLPGCGRPVPKDREMAPFCSDRCEAKASVTETPDYHKRAVQQLTQPNTFWAQNARILDGGLWKGQNHKAKVRRMSDGWREQ